MRRRLMIYQTHSTHFIIIHMCSSNIQQADKKVSLTGVQGRICRPDMQLASTFFFGS